MKLSLATLIRSALSTSLIFLWPPSFAETVRFVDMTLRSGIHFRHASDPEKRYIVESMSGGVALFDVDNDGRLDIYFVNSPTVGRPDPKGAPSHLYLNKGDWTFEEVGQKAGVAHPGWGMGACVGDYDGDGRLDLYVTALGDNRLYHNTGRGTFVDRAAEAGANDPRWATGCAFADYDADGDLDLFVANYVDVQLGKLPEFGRGPSCRYQGIPVQCGPRGLPGAGDSLFRNEGNGRFKEVSRSAGVADRDGYYGLGVVWTDFDLDGDPDLFVANDGRPNYFYRNRGDGTFQEYGFLSGAALAEDGAEQACMGIAVGDVDRDGQFDLFVTNFSNEYNVLYRNLGNWLVSDRSYASRTALPGLPYVGWGTFFFDYDNDGFLDLLAVNGHVYPQIAAAGIGLGYAQPKLLFRGKGDGTFEDVSKMSGEALTLDRASRGAAVGDLDDDGDPDIVINDIDGAPMALQNQGGHRRHWLRVRLEGRGGNRFAIGSRVRLKAGDAVLIEEVRSGGSYLSQSDLRLHFGLGERRLVDWIEVRWPDGRLSKLENIAADREIVLRQPN